MLIEINTDNHIEGKERMKTYFEGLLEEAFRRYDERITRLEVQLGDENSGEKKGTDDKRCMLEARLSGLAPVAVVNHSDTLEKAVSGAIKKLKNALEHSIGKVQHH
jgi:hypothetical protein